VHAVEVVMEAGASILAGRGELDLYAASDLERAFEMAANEEHAVVVDLAAVSFMDSSALGALVRGARALEESGRPVRVVLPRGSARRVFELTNVEHVLAVARSRADALAELAAGDG
jgi:anti-sigma B factor antagonist